MLLPPSAFFIIGLIIWTVRELKPEQTEKVEYKIMSIAHGEGGHH
jgi:Na+-transporting NADH:ubiquinone oxidoreductase subunit D